VWSDDAAAVRSVVECLAALGHRRIAPVAGVANLRHTLLRSHSLDAVAELDLPEATIVHTDYSGAAGAAVTPTLLSRRPVPAWYHGGAPARSGGEARLSTSPEILL
jgi:DNA-binding LacI/PurR family transcriptional regulator